MIAFVLDHPLLSSGLTLLLAALCTEAYFRIRFRNLLWIQVYPRVYMPDEDLGYRYAPNSEGTIRIPGIFRRFRINNRGFHARDFVVAKPAGAIRIAVIGTSNTTGIWMDGTGKNFCETLEEILRAAGHHVEIMNFGIDGRFRSLHEIRIIDTDVVEYSPDLVLLDIDIPFIYGSFRRAVYRNYVMIYSCENETSRRWCEAAVDEAEAQWFLIMMYRALYIVRAAVRYYMNRYNTPRSAKLRTLVENRVQAPDVVVLPYSLKRSVETLQAVRDKLEAKRAKLILFQFSPNLYYRQVTQKYDLGYIELNVPPLPPFVHDRDGHYRHVGHLEIARQMAEQLSTRGALDVPQAGRSSVG